jgi:hypothetical protein
LNCRADLVILSLNIPVTPDRYAVSGRWFFRGRDFNNVVAHPNDEEKPENHPVPSSERED